MSKQRQRLRTQRTREQDAAAQAARRLLNRSAGSGGKKGRGDVVLPPLAVAAVQRAHMVFRASGGVSVALRLTDEEGFAFPDGRANRPSGRAYCWLLCGSGRSGFVAVPVWFGRQTPSPDEIHLELAKRHVRPPSS